MKSTEKLSRYSLTEYNRSERLLRRLRDIYSRAKSYHWAHREILDALGAEIYATKDWAKLKPYYRGVFAGTSRALGDELYAHYLEWRLYLGGRLVTSKEVPAGEWGRVKGGEHVWTAAPDRLFSTPDLTPAAPGVKVHP